METYYEFFFVKQCNYSNCVLLILPTTTFSDFKADIGLKPLKISHTHKIKTAFENGFKNLYFTQSEIQQTQLSTVGDRFQRKQPIIPSP